MKIVNLCSSGCCPVVKVDEERVEIGEAENTCILTRAEWETLKRKVMEGEL